jgi:hypothetical protein
MTLKARHTAEELEAKHAVRIDRKCEAQGKTQRNKATGETCVSDADKA